jgi:photosystem II stability/assembly factor-like uncharacterized protein
MKTSDAGGAWERLSEGLPENGRASALAVDPSDGRNVFAAIPEDGVYRSMDGGETWMRSSNGLPADRQVLAMDTIVVDPNRPSRVLAGSLRVLYRSDDGGATWRGQPEPVGHIVFHPRRPGVAYGVGRFGVSKSVDGGESWRVLGGPAGFVWDVAVDSTRDGVIYVTAESLWRTNDDGATWEREPRLFDIRGVAADPQSTLVYASTGDGIVASTDGFRTWKRIGPPRTAYAGVLAVAPGRLYVGTEATRDIFVTKLDLRGEPVYSTYIGSAADDFAVGMSLSADGSVFVAGLTYSGDFPAARELYAPAGTPSPYSPTGSFVVRIDPDGNRRSYSARAQRTRRGRHSAALRSRREWSSRRGAAFRAAGGGSIAPCFARDDGFLMKIDPSGGSLAYSTYFTAGESGLTAIAVDAEGNRRTPVSDPCARAEPQAAGFSQLQDAADGCGAVGSGRRAEPTGREHRDPAVTLPI